MLSTQFEIVSCYDKDEENILLLRRSVQWIQGEYRSVSQNHASNRGTQYLWESFSIKNIRCICNLKSNIGRKDMAQLSAIFCLILGHVIKTNTNKLNWLLSLLLIFVFSSVDMDGKATEMEK